jgi:hypothetical protein
LDNQKVKNNLSNTVQEISNSANQPKEDDMWFSDMVFIVFVLIMIVVSIIIAKIQENKKK